MVNSTYNVRNYASATLSWLIIFGLAALFKGSYLVGSGHGHFASIPLLLPLLGTACLPLTAIFGFLRLLTGAGYPLLSLLRLPTICGGLYWSQNHWFIRAVIPALCMALFLAHPVGLAGWGYAMLWLIPIGVWVVNNNNLYLTALGCTMTVHAVGSVIWLYSIPMTVAQWWALIPVALFERIMFAGLMVLLYLVQRKLSSVIAHVLSHIVSRRAHAERTRSS